jgi:transposase
VRVRDLYATILGLTAPWEVTDVEVDAKSEVVAVHVEAKGRSTHSCPECGRSCPGYDARERRWRHLDTCQFQTVLVAQVPRVQCPEHGVRQVAVPWGEPGSGFTAMLERLIIDWLKEASVAAVARRLSLSWDQIDGVMQRAVARGLVRRKPEELIAIGVDETSFQKRHEYVTVVTDLTQSKVLYVADHRRKSSLDGFYESCDSDRLEGIAIVAMDMCKAYISSTMQHVPGAADKICFDRFHVSKIFGDALNKVRSQEHRDLLAIGDTSLTRTKHLFLRRGDSLSAQDEGVVDILRRAGLKSARAWAIKEAATKLWDYATRGWARKAWKKLISWAMRSRIEPMKAAARTVREHLWGILNAVRHKASNAGAESVNAKIQRVKRMACGYRNRDRFRTAIMFHLGGLDLYPASATHTSS